MEELDTSMLGKDPDTSLPRNAMSEVGYTGIKSISGKILEEANYKLRYPYFLSEVKEMLNDATIATGMSFQRHMITRVKWKVIAPRNASPELKERAKFIESCKDDMEHSWFSFISELASYIPYGFAVHEKVFYRRLNSKGSKYNDGLKGWRKLPIRSQSTIDKWEFSEDGREIKSCYQSTKNLTNMGTFFTNLGGIDNGSEIRIPRNKFLLFTADSRLGDPTGNSPLKAVWVLWRYRKELERIQAIAAARDMEGVAKVSIPSSYMSPYATPEQKAFYKQCTEIASNFHVNSQSGLVFPSDTDDKGKRFVDIEFLTTDSSGKAHIEETINRINSQILLALGADILALGNNGQGSFSLASAKTSLTALMLDYRLREIRDVLNNDLIRSTFEANGWDTSELPTFEYEDFDTPDLDEKSKYLQRVASQSIIPRNLDVVNMAMRDLELPELPDDTDLDDLEFFGGKSRSGDGMAAGGLNGTSTGSSDSDTSISNAENT